MIKFGTKVIPVEGPARVGIRADGPFTVYGLADGKRVSILGPKNEQARVARFSLAEHITPEIVCEDSVCWTLDYQANRSAEVLDKTPMEIPIDVRPPSIREEMRQYIRTVISQNAEEVGVGTFEEEDDFDIPDEFDPISPYEIQEMIEEEYIESNPIQRSSTESNNETPPETSQEGHTEDISENTGQNHKLFLNA